VLDGLRWSVGEPGVIGECWNDEDVGRLKEVVMGVRGFDDGFRECTILAFNSL
jgi:hypothetical protein